MCGWHPRAIDKQVYNKNGPNLMGSVEDFAPGTRGLLALNTIQGEGGDVFVLSETLALKEAGAPDHTCPFDALQIGSFDLWPCFPQA